MKSKEEVYSLILKDADKVYSKCVDYTIEFANTDVILVDYDINGAIDSLLMNRDLDEDESLREGLYSILEDINSVEFDMYEKEAFSIYMGFYDAILDYVLKKLHENGFKIYIKSEDYNYAFDYYIVELQNGDCTNCVEVEDDALCAFIVTFPYDIVVFKR